MELHGFFEPILYSTFIRPLTQVVQFEMDNQNHREALLLQNI